MLSERGKRRLRIAAGLLRSEGVKFDCPRDQFYERIQDVLAGLPAERQATLKGLVDWVEEYELASPAQAPTSARGS